MNTMDYEILIDSDNDLILVIEEKDSDPLLPMLICDGSDNALLFRNFESSIRLKNLSKEAAQLFLENDFIYVAEKNGSEIVRDYMASIRKVENVMDLIRLE